MAESAHRVVALNEAQRAEWDAGTVPAVEELRCEWWSIPTEIPAGTLPATLTYAQVGADGVCLIDPGWDSDANARRLDRALAALGRRLADIDTIIVTHHHPDHLGLAARLRETTGASIVMSARERHVLSGLIAQEDGEREREAHRLARWGVPLERLQELIDAFAAPSTEIRTVPDRVVSDGDSIAVGGRRLQAVLTPGHTGGHLCLADREARMLFTGDHVLPRIHSGIGIGVVDGDEPLSDALTSLDRLSEFDDFDVLPGHEFRFAGLAPRRRAIAAHHLRRTAEVAALADELGDQPVWRYAERLTWTSGWSGLTGFWLHSALRQTELHLNAVRQGSVDRWLNPGG